MINVTEARKGVTVEMEGALYQVLDFEHIKMGRGSAQVRMKLRNVRRGDLIEKTFQAGDRFARARLDQRDVQYMYNDGDLYHFMDDESYEQVALNGSQLEGVLPFLKDGSPVSILRYEDRVIGVEVPLNVELKVIETEPGIRGDTVSASFKPARVETGASVNVPLFVNQGDVIKVDTRTGSYLERV